MRWAWMNDRRCAVAHDFRNAGRWFTPQQPGPRVARASARIARPGPPTDWGELAQAHDDRDVFRAAPDEMPVIDILTL